MGGYIISTSHQSAPNSVFELSRHFGTCVECLKFTKNALLQGACPLQSGKFFVLTEIANTYSILWCQKIEKCASGTLADQRSDIWQMVKTKIRSKNGHKCTKIGSFGVKKPLNCGCPRKCRMDMVASGADGQKELDSALALCQGMRATPIFHFLGNLRRGAPMGG